MEGSFVNIDQTDMQQDPDNPYFLEGEEYAQNRGSISYDPNNADDDEETEKNVLIAEVDETPEEEPDNTVSNLRA